MSFSFLKINVEIFNPIPREIKTAGIYFFDEIDTNFDSKNNRLFIYLIKQLASAQNQIFLISFKKNSIINGDKWFGFSISHEGSTFENISKNLALRFINQKN